MFLAINFESEIPIYTQIRQQIIEGIASGKLTSGEGLPSVRQLASDLGVNMHTVNKAYSQLRQDGFIVIHKRRGVLVASKGQMHSRESDLEMEIRPILAEAISRGESEKNIVKLVQSIYSDIIGGQNNV